MLMTPQSWSHSEAGAGLLQAFWVTDFRLIPRGGAGPVLAVLRRELTAAQTPGSAVPGILQERTLEWVAISFSNA